MDDIRVITVADVFRSVLRARIEGLRELLHEQNDQKLMAMIADGKCLLGTRSVMTFNADIFGANTTFDVDANCSIKRV